MEATDKGEGREAVISVSEDMADELVEKADGGSDLDIWGESDR